MSLKVIYQHEIEGLLRHQKSTQHNIGVATYLRTTKIKYSTCQQFLPSAPLRPYQVR